ncbi:hypothetical protein MTO96_008771 [Rhipicephalus appendiculatus]
MQRFSRPRRRATVCEALMDETQQHDAGWEEAIGVVPVVLYTTEGIRTPSSGQPRSGGTILKPRNPGSIRGLQIWTERARTPGGGDSLRFAIPRRCDRNREGRRRRRPGRLSSAASGGGPTSRRRPSNVKRRRRLDERRRQQQQQQGSSGGVAGRGAVAARGADTDYAASAVDVRRCSLAAAAAAPLPPARGGRWRRGSSTGSVLAEPFAWPSSLHGRPPLGHQRGSGIAAVGRHVSAQRASAASADARVGAGLARGERHRALFQQLAPQHRAHAKPELQRLWGPRAASQEHRVRALEDLLQRT